MAMSPELQKMLEDTEMMFREEGVSYSVKELVETRRDQATRDLALYPEDAYVTLKVPSGFEQDIPAPLVRYYLRRAW